MAAVVLGVTTASTSQATSYASGSFTPAAGDLLVTFVIATVTVGFGTVSSSQALGGWTEITRALKAVSTDTAYLFVANALAANSAMTVTFDCTGDTATGCIVTVLRVSGMTNVGSAAVRQFDIIENQAGGADVDWVLPAAPLTTNPIVAMIANGTNPATLAPTATFVERSDTGYASPTTGMYTQSVDGGHTSVNINVSASGGATCAIAAELDASGAATGQPTMKRWGGIPNMGGSGAGPGGGLWGRTR